MMKLHLLTLSGALAGALSLAAGAAQAECGGAYPVGSDPYGYPAAYVLIPNWGFAPCVHRGRSGYRLETYRSEGYRPNPLGIPATGWYNKDSYAARGTEYDPEHPDPGVVSGAH